MHVLLYMDFGHHPTWWWFPQLWRETSGMDGDGREAQGISQDPRVDAPPPHFSLRCGGLLQCGEVPTSGRMTPKFPNAAGFLCEFNEVIHFLVSFQLSLKKPRCHVPCCHTLLLLTK